LKFADNGRGLTDKFDKIDLFSKGVSTTSGSGIGLNHVKQIVDSMKGTIQLENGSLHGAIVKIEFK